METIFNTAAAVRFLIAMPAAYLAGSINFAILLFRLLGWEDPRTRFSGNPGVTNVYRQAGWPAAAGVLVLDMGRAAAVALLALHLLPYALVPWAALALILGNHFPCFHGFQGGKGVANFLGFCAVLMPLGTLISLAVYVAVFALVRIAFLGSFGMLAALTYCGLQLWWADAIGIAGLLITVGSIVFYHRSNITNLLNRLSKGRRD